MFDNSPLPFSLPSVQRKKVTAAFDSGRMTSDGGVLLLSAVESKIGIADRLAPLINDPRNPLLVSERKLTAAYHVYASSGMIPAPDEIGLMSISC